MATPRKPRAEWTVDETLEHLQTGAEPVDPGYAEEVRDLLENRDLDVPDEFAAPIDPNDETAEQIFQRIRRHRD